jgi:hypothetical protein
MTGCRPDAIGAAPAAAATSAAPQNLGEGVAPPPGAGSQSARGGGAHEGAAPRAPAPRGVGLATRSFGPGGDRSRTADAESG